MAKKKIDWERLQNDINSGNFNTKVINVKSAKEIREASLPKITTSVSKKTNSNNGNLAPIKHNANDYQNTGKKIGDYIKDSSMKNYDIFSKDNKFYYYDSKNKSYKEITNKTGYDTKRNTNAKKKQQIAPINEHFNNKQQVEAKNGKFEESSKKAKAREDKLGLADRLSVEFSSKNAEEKKKMENELVQEEKNNSRLTGFSKDLASSGYIKAGAFDDGYQPGDVSKTVLSTGLSVFNSLGRGTLNLLEGASDTLGYGASSVIDALGFDETADKLRGAYKENWVNKITMPSKEAYGDSVLGEKSDSIVESIGQNLPVVGVSGLASTAKGATALSSGTMFASSYGQGVSEAYENGATDDEAQKYGLINGVANTATEMMFGGLGTGSKALGISHGVFDSADDALAQKISTIFSSKLAQNLTQYSIKGAGEGIEEVAAGLLQGIGKKLTFESEKDLQDILNDEQLLDQFIGGAVASGIMQVPGLVKSTKQGRSITSGFTDNEQKVFENISNARFEQELQNNSNMSKTEQNKLRTSIEKQTKADIENGNLSLSELQNALGNDDYQTYRQETKRKQDLESQLKELQNKLTTDMSYSEYNENNQKIADLQNQINSIDLDTLKQNVDTPIENRIGNNDYLLQKSYHNYKYNEAQKSVSFKYEPKFDENGNEVKISQLEKNVYDSASKFMNNTKESHNLADFVSKLSKDTGVQYEFTTTEDLKNRGYNIKDDKVVNGLNTEEGKILVNFDSEVAINRILGHETMHLFESTEDYKILQNEVFEYAKMKGDFDKLKSKISETYKNIKGANIDNELTSELVGQYIFSDTEFVQNLSKHRNIFQKIYDKIKHIYNMATAGSKEARQLEKVKRTFEKVYQNNEAKASKDNKYMIAGIKGVKNDVKVNSEDSIVIDWYNKAHNMKKQGYSNEEIRQKTGWFQDRKGKWKFEISDDKAKLINKPQRNKSYKLVELLEHNDLYEMYPKLKKIKVKFKNIKDSIDPKTKKPNIIAGYYNELKNTISMNNKLMNINNAENIILNTLLHEAQHIVQKTEGFNKGYLGDDIEGYKRNLGEQEAVDTERRRKLNYKQRKEIAPYSSKIEKNSQIDYNTNRGETNEKNNSNYKKLLLVQDTEKHNEGPTYDRRGSRGNVEGRNKKLENNTENSNTSSFSLEQYKRQQLDIIQNNNPANDDYHAWIRGLDDIKTFNEALQDDESGFTPDYTESMANEALNRGNITVYSSYPIEQGTFVTPSKMEAESYAGNGKIYSKTVNLQDVAWLDLLQGQYAKVENANYSLSDNNSDLIVPLKRGEFLSKDVKLDKPIAPIKKISNANVKTNKVVKTQNKSNAKASKVNLPTKKISDAEFKKDIKANAKKMSNTINSIIDSNTMTVKSDLPDLNIRSWVETAIESDVVDNKILLDDINMLKATYEVKSNKKSLEKANSQINLKGYDRALQDFNSLLTNEKANISVENIVMGERLVQEAMKNNDYKTAQELIENIAILGTELGQKVQALSVIQRLTPEGQLRMLTKTIQRAKIKGDKAFDGVQISPEMAEKVLSTYNQDGTWNQDKLNEAVEEVKGEIAEQMKTTVGEKVNAWRYLSMLGNPKTHIRNLVSNVAMKATRKYKNFIARSIEAGVRKIQKASGKETTANSRTFSKPSEFIKQYSEETTTSLKDIIQESNKYDEATELNRMKTIFEKGTVTKATEKILSKIKNDKVEFQNGVLEKLYRFNSDMLQKEDWWFSSSAFEDTLSEYLTANNIRTQEDIESNPEIVERAKALALEESQKATFQQYSWIASWINRIENKNIATQLVFGGLVPFKKTPINIAKAGLSYSPIGLTKSLIYDLARVKQGKMEASQAIDNIAQGVAGTSLALLGYVMAKAGILNGAGEDDKKGKYDNQLGTQTYSIKIGDSTYSLNWLSPVAMPLFVGVNFQNQLEEQQDWDMNVLSGALAQTLDPLTEMSVLQGINQALSSYNSDDMVGGNLGYATSSAFESYLTQFIPTASSYLAGTIDDKKRTTTPSADSKFKQGEAILNQIKYKIPGLRQTLPVSQDIWGNEVKQSDNVFQRAFENFLLPASKKSDISDVVDDEIIRLYDETGETGIIPSTPPKYLKYEDEKYNFSSKEYSDYRKTYGSTAKEGLRDLFNSQEYINASDEDKVKYIESIYDYAREKSKVNYFNTKDVNYELKSSYEKTTDYIDNGGTLASYVTTHNYLESIEADKDSEGNSINGTATGKKAYYIMNSNLTTGQKNWFLSDISDSAPTTEDLSLLDNSQNVYNYYFGLNTENKDKFKLLAKAGISQSNYIKFKETEFKSDKDSTGKTISGSKKSKIINFVNELPLTVAEKAMYIKSAYKSFDDYNNEIINYINNQNLSLNEKTSILEDLGFEIKGGRVYW